MISSIIGSVIGVALVLLVTRAFSRPSRPAVPARPAPPPAFEDPFIERVHQLENALQNIPQPTLPDELLQVRPFVELVETFSARGDASMLLDYAAGTEAVPAWAALAALARQPHDPGIEERLMVRLNGFHPWSRHFILRALEAWHPDEPELAGRVLLRLDSTWDQEAYGDVLDAFLRRRARVAPLTLEGLVRPAGFDGDLLQMILRHWVDPILTRPIIVELGDTPPLTRIASPFGALVPGAPAAGLGTLEGIGHLTPPGKMRSEGVLGCPSADAQLERALAAIAGTPHRPVLIVGEPGVGKSALIRRAAARLSQQDWTIFEAGAAQLNAGMVYIGSIEGRLQALVRTLSAQPRMLWVCPDFQQLLWAGRSSQSPVGILEMLLPTLESGAARMLGELRPAALEKVLVQRPEVARLFEIVRLEAPSEAETAGMLEQWAGTVGGAELPAAIRREASALARQYLVTEPPPGGDLRLLREALGHALRREPDSAGTRSVTMDDLVRGLANLTGLPLDILDERCPLDLEAVRERFTSHVMGQAEAVDCLVERLALLKAGVTDPRRPIGVFLFAGRSGTGKTELARTLAAYLFGSPDRLVRVDMSELQEAHALERLLGDGSPVASQGNSLAERVRRHPFSVVLLDEFDRAHPRIWDVFLQVFDAGRLTDNRGDVADFRHTIIILTSNLGSASGEMRLGLTSSDGGGSGPSGVLRAVERAFRPELLNRLDRVVVFRPLTRDVMRQILRKEMAEAFARRGLRRRDWAVEMEESAIELLVERGFSPTLGARPLKRALERLLLAPLAAAIVDRSAPAGDQFLFVRADGDALHVEFVDPDAIPVGAPPAGMAGAAEGPGAVDVASILFEARGEANELAALRTAFDGLERRVGADAWATAKRDLLLESAAPDFWERPDRFERLGRVEYMDRIENTLRSAASLLERLQGNPRAPRLVLPREMVRRLAQQLYLLDAASCEAVELGPRDAFVSVEPSHDDAAPSSEARAFAVRIAAMYEGWARARGMRLAELAGGDDGSQVMAIAGFAAYRLLAPESGLHVLEWDEPGGRGTRRAAVRVRVEPQPPVPARDGVAALRRQAEEALAGGRPQPVAVVRRYREKPSPLVRDLVRSWRTGRIERVLGGDFDVMPVKG